MFDDPCAPQLCYMDKLAVDERVDAASRMSSDSHAHDGRDANDTDADMPAKNQQRLKHHVSFTDVECSEFNNDALLELCKVAEQKPKPVDVPPPQWILSSKLVSPLQILVYLPHTALWGQ